MKSTMDSGKGKLVARPKDEWVRVDGMHEAIVMKEEFTRVQEMVSAQKPASGKRKMRYACGVCGKRLTRRNRTDLYCNRGYMVKDCECRQVVMKEPEADVARSFLDVGEMTEEIWERFVKVACVYPDGRIEVRWNFGDEMNKE